MSIKEQIDELQEEMYSNEDYESFFLEHSEVGNIGESISLLIYKYDTDIEMSLWNSENDEREWIEEKNDYEDLKPFLLRKIEDCLMAFTELKERLIK